jgi:hypothetical protein
MAKKYIVQRYPMNHPTDGLIPVGEEVDLSHLSDDEIKLKLERRQIAVKRAKSKSAAVKSSEE